MTAMDSAGLDPAAPPRASPGPAARPWASIRWPRCRRQRLTRRSASHRPAQPVSMPGDPRMAGLTPEVVADLVRRGKKIQAIKLYRELANVDLKTAKYVIDSL